MKTPYEFRSRRVVVTLTHDPAIPRVLSVTHAPADYRADESNPDKFRLSLDYLPALSAIFPASVTAAGSDPNVDSWLEDKSGRVDLAQFAGEYDLLVVDLEDQEYGEVTTRAILTGFRPAEVEAHT